MHDDNTTTTPVRGDHPELLNGRYRVDEILKAGGGIVTARAIDTVSGTPTVVKTTLLGTVPDGTEMLLRHEAAVLRKIDSPHVAPLLDVGVDDGRLFLVAPQVDGVTLDERLANGPLSLTDALALADALVEALGAVFEHGVLHRDVKPSNIIVNTDTPITSVTLVDFGFSRCDRLDPALRDVPLGTARYSSPEQAGLIDRVVDERSDLYSTGAVLFQALAGRAPFPGDSVREVLNQHLTAPVPSLRELGAHVPRALDEVVQRLLAKDPKDRYQTASAVLFDLREIRAAVRRGDTDPRVVVGAHDHRCCALGEPAFVGRASELSLLDGARDQARRGEASLVGLEAESGGGKTRVLDEFARRSTEQGAWVLRGQGVDQAAQRPFQALRGVAEAVVAAASADPELADHLRFALGDQRAAACAALPALDEILHPERDEELGPEDFGARRSISALAALLDALGSSERAAVVLLDDCQWADPLTVRLIRHWRDSRSSRGRHALVVVAFRTEEVPAGHLLREANEDGHVELPPLGEREVRDLVESMAGRLDEPIARFVVSLAQGSPFMASAMLHGLVEAGALTCSHPGWTANPDALADVQSSNRAGTFLAHRLELLDRPTLDLLSAGAILGKEFDLETAAHLARQDAHEAVRAREAARGRHLVWSNPRGASVSFVHDKIREALLARLDPDERRALHGEAAQYLEAHDDSRVFDLAYHYDAAGKPDEALPYALAAAQTARSQHSLEIAEEQYLIAQRASAGAASRLRFEVASGLGDVNMLLGRYDEARRHFTQALDLAQGRVEQASVEARRGELAFKHGDVETAAAASEHGLRLLGKRVPKRLLGFLLAAMWEIAVQASHTLFPSLFVGRRPLERGSEDLLAARLYSRLAHVYWFTRGPIPTLWTHLREMNVAERYEPSRELAQAYSEHAPVMTLLPWFRRGIEYVERSYAIRHELNDVWGQGQSLNFYGIVLFTAGRYDEAVEKCREAIRLLERTGDRWELNIARLHLAYAMYRQGRLADAIAVSRSLYDDAVEIGDLQGSGIAAEIRTLAAEGRVPEEVLGAELDRDTRDVQLQVQVMQGEAVRLLAAGDPGGAVRVLDDAVERAHRAQIRNEYVAPARVWRATALRQHVESLPPYGSERDLVLRRARRATRNALRISRVYRNNRPHALREAALVAALSNRPRRARRSLARSVECAVRRGMAFEEALSLVELGRLGEAWLWPGSAEAGAEGAERLAELRGAVDRVVDDAGGIAPAPEVTLSLVERFDTLLDHGRRLASGLSREVVFAAVEDAALKLLRAEECAVFDVASDGSVEGNAVASSSILGPALQTGRPVSDLDIPDGSASDSVVLAGVRSFICAPILERGEVTACFYATHSGVAELFGDDELRLAEFVATVAGAALENARGFAEVETLQRSLEERVEARTAQLTTTLRELERVNTELQEASDAKSDFVSMVSHELRTPLTPIVGLSSTMLHRWDEMEADVVVECLDAIHRQGTRLSRIVDDLLEISRIEAGTLEAVPRRVNVAELITTTIDGMAGLEEVDVSCPTDLFAMADPDRLQQILINYLENARKYGRPPVDVVARGDASWVEIAVRDRGDGVPPEFAGELFEKFARSETAKEVSGTGLGLSIVRGLARAQGGDAWYEARDPRGATFAVRLPRVPRVRRENADTQGVPEVSA